MKSATTTTEMKGTMFDVESRTKNHLRNWYKTLGL